MKKTFREFILHTYERHITGDAVRQEFNKNINVAFLSKVSAIYRTETSQPLHAIAVTELTQSISVYFPRPVRFHKR